MIRKILSLFNMEIVYTYTWPDGVTGVYSRKYDDADRYFTRPIHRDMSVAPPDAKMKIVKVTK